MKKILLFASILAFAAIIINYSLGGFKEVEPGLISNEEIVIYGRLYEGSYSSEALDDLISELRQVIKTSDQSGQLTIVNYKQPELEKRGTVKQFIGINWHQQQVNSEYDRLSIEAYNGVQFNIPVRPLVMPSPEKLDDMAKEYANEMQTSLAGYSIEQYRDKNLVINYPFKSN